MGGSFDRMVDAAYKGRSVRELALAPPDALAGVSSTDATRLREAFGIRRIVDMAWPRYFMRASAIAAAASDIPGYDPGPPPHWEARFRAAPLDAYEEHSDVFRIAFGPVYYRGRLDGTARILVVGQDPSVNELIGHRVFAGSAGQRLQGFLKKVGITRSYLMLNTFLFSIFGQFGDQNARLSREPPIMTYRNSLFEAAEEDNPLEAILTVGQAARDAVSRWPGGSGVPRIHMKHPSVPNERDLLDNWNAALEVLWPLIEPDEGAQAAGAYGEAFTPEDMPRIPQRDLPFGMPSWHGQGDHAARNGDAIIEWRA